jgi:hypothetical protein
MSWRIAAIILALLAYSPHAFAAADKTGSIVVLGYGLSSCGTWTADHTSKASSSFPEDQWVLGYVTSFNAWNDGTSNISGDTDNTGLLEWVSNYCAQYPLNSISQASASLMVALYAKQMPAKKH